jgi:hypothetical protein
MKNIMFIVCLLIALLAVNTYTFAQTPTNVRLTAPLGGAPIGEELPRPSEGGKASSSSLPQWVWSQLGDVLEAPASVVNGILTLLEEAIGIPSFAGVFQTIRDVIAALAYLFGALFYALTLWVAWQKLKPKKKRSGGKKKKKSN